MIFDHRSCNNNTTKQVCSYCNKTFSDLETHNQKCKNNPANHSTICKFCGGSRKDMEAHLVKCDLNPANGKMCLFCHKVDSFSRNMNGHMENCALNPINAEITCEFCHDKFKQKTLINHQRRCLYNPVLINCEICNGRFEVHEYERHIASCDNIRGIKSNTEKKQSNDDVAVLTSILMELSLKLKYKDMDDMLQDHDLCCSVCYEPTCNKTTTLQLS